MNDIHAMMAQQVGEQANISASLIQPTDAPRKRQNMHIDTRITYPLRKRAFARADQPNFMPSLLKPQKRVERPAARVGAAEHVCYSKWTPHLSAHFRLVSNTR